MQIQKFVLCLIATAILAVTAGAMAGFGLGRTLLFAAAVAVAMQLCYVGFVLAAASRKAPDPQRPRPSRSSAALGGRRRLAAEERSR